MLHRFSVSIISLFFAAAALAWEPAGLFLTWQQDPTSTMTIDWHTIESDRPSELEYRAGGSDEWEAASGKSHPFPHGGRTIHRVELTLLDAGATYAFRFSDDSPVYRFRTMPDDLTEPMRIAIGGDVQGSQEAMERTNRVAMQYDPDFIVWGGDLAYANADPRNVETWYSFFDAIKNTLIDENNRVVPIIVAIGNHEVFWRPRYSGDEAHLPDEWGYQNHDAVFFYDLFAFPKKPGYGALDFGQYLSLIVLNTDHGIIIPGHQTQWLRTTLAGRKNQTHVIPIYHVPAYPAHRDYDGWANPEIRANWSPLFEEYGVKVAFEAHDHAYKRTPPIRREQIDGSGVVYMGDGAWGVGTREVHPAETTWYLERSESVRHFILLTLQGQHQHIMAIDDSGNVIDEYPQPPQPRAPESTR